MPFSKCKYGLYYISICAAGLWMLCSNGKAHFSNRWAHKMRNIPMLLQTIKYGRYKMNLGTYDNKNMTVHLDSLDF